MDSQVPYTATPPSYSSSQPTPYPTGGAASTPYAAGQTPYPPQQYPPPSQGKLYPPPGTGYSPQPGTAPPYVAAPPPQQPQQQQQQQVVVVSHVARPLLAAQPAVIVQHVPSYVGHIVFACFVAWCCNPLIGLIAFILASQYSLFTIILNINMLTKFIKILHKKLNIIDNNLINGDGDGDRFCLKPKPKVVMRRHGRHFENRYNVVITLPGYLMWMQFGMRTR